MANIKKNALNQVLFLTVDPTDFATIKSALGTPPTGKFFGVNHGGSAAATSGAISKTISQVHSGLWRATLKAAETNYDFLALRFTQASAADQILTFQTVNNNDSNVVSQLTIIKSAASDAMSAAQQANSRLLVNQSVVSDIRSQLTLGIPLDASTISDIRSAIAAGPAATVTASDISDIASAVWANTIGARVDSRVLLALSAASDAMSAAQQGNSRLLVNQSVVSDIRSQLNAGIPLDASTISDIRSAIAAGPAATVTASDISDIASAVWANAIGTRVDSRLLVNQSVVSDIRSQLNAGIPLDASTMSDIRSAITASPTVSVSDISDIASAVWANTIGARVDSRLLVAKSTISDVYSLISDFKSAAATATQLASRVWSNTIGARVDSRLLVAVSAASDAMSAAQQANSRLLVNQSVVSDIRSQLTAGIPLDASTISDIRSAIAAGPAATVTASDISDIASAVWANVIGARVDSRVLVMKSTLSDAYSLLTAGVALDASTMSDIRSAIAGGAAATITASDISDIASAVWANTIGARVDSRLLVVKSQASDVASQITAGVPLDASTMSDIRSAITAGGAAAITVSDISDIASAVWANTIGARVDSRLLVTKSTASDAASAAAQANSRALVIQSQTSDIASLLAAGVSLDPSTISDIRSAITAGGIAALSVSDISDIASAVWANTIGARVDSRVLVVKSQASDIASLLAAGVALDASTISDIRSAIATVPDSMLNRNLAGGGSGNTRNVRNALRGSRNLVQISGGVMKVYQEDDTTPAWSAAVSTAAGNPIVKIDP